MAINTGTVPFPITGMPEELAVVVRQYDRPTRRLMLKNWTVIGEDARRRYRIQLAGANNRWTRRVRCEIAAKRLMTEN